MLRRFLRYIERLYGVKEELASVTDRRQKPQLPTFRVVAGLFLMACIQAGSLNGIEQALRNGPARCVWHKWLGGDLPSADRLGEVAAILDVDQLRKVLVRHYQRRRRKKTLHAPKEKRFILVLDGHEYGASYYRCCKNCLNRTVHVQGEERIQYYHRYVLGYLFRGDGRLYLDMEMQLPGEGEITAARRLIHRALQSYPRAFQVVVGDALYADPQLCKELLAAGKHFIAVLKNEARDLVQDFESLRELVPAITVRYQKRRCICRDIEGFTTWPQVGRAVRVVSSEEQQTIRRCRTRELQTTKSKWMWVTSLDRTQMDTTTLVELGHRRWDIENYGFNELATRWHADHIYHHDINAMMAILLLILLAVNLFHAWQSRNLKPELRDKFPIRFFERLLQGDFYHELKISTGPDPP